MTAQRNDMRAAEVRVSMLDGHTSKAVLDIKAQVKEIVEEGEKIKDRLSAIEDIERER